MEALQAICLFLTVCAGTTIATSEGQSFVFAFSQVRSDFSEGACVIYINSKVATTATIVDPDGTTEEATIQAGVTFSKSYDYTYRVLDGVEQRGFVIESEDDISVMLANYRADSHLDTILVPPVTSDTQEYMIITFPSTNDITCIGGATCAYFTVAAYQDDTEVNIFKMVDGIAVTIDTVTLNMHDVLTNRTLNLAVDRSYDFTGYYITADKPVAVTAGNPCADTNPNEIASAIWASMALDQAAGTTHISHTLNYKNEVGPTIVRIMALEDNTVVDYDGNSNTIQYRGEFFNYIFSSDDHVVFECDKPCRAAQYSNNSVETVSGGAAVFMALLVPTNTYGSDVVFNKPDIGSTSTTMIDYMSINYLTETPGDSPMFYDGTELQGWVTQTGQGFSSLELEIAGAREIQHSLTTDPGSPLFSALIHGQWDDGRGYAYIAGFGETGAGQETTSVAPTSNPNITIPSPQYRIAMTGNFGSGDGSDFTTECTSSYSDAMNNEAALMMVQVNGLVGSSLCTAHTLNDIELLTVSTPFVTSGNRGATELRFILKTDLATITQDQVVTCGDEIGLYLLDHANWPNPGVLPILPNCPRVVFDSQMFNDSGKDWICFGNQEDHPVNKQAVTLRYSVRHTGLFATDGTDLTPQCVLSYNNDFDFKTFEQVQNVQAQINAGSMCAGTGVNMGTAVTSLTAQGSQGSSLQNYVLIPGAASLAPQIYSCATEISEYMSPHTNWNRPILPPSDGCPEVTFDPELFVEDSQEWLCV